MSPEHVFASVPAKPVVQYTVLGDATHTLPIVGVYIHCGIGGRPVAETNLMKSFPSPLQCNQGFPWACNPVMCVR